MKSFHGRLAQALREEDVSQRELATRTGVDVTNVCHLMHGRRDPTLPTLCKILRALPSTDARWLILGPIKDTKRRKS